ncbi:NarK/NasA family nitrate transporter [Candidatus Sumerlaeota bacterium]|nr:NarK/NasA family nitrate transporter [Candidatus Sumerlaeota bacterium]MBI3735684.1 NarK/NasA family nitrate transporter [Candidatus Sumerlaeota bacterium]
MKPFPERARWRILHFSWIAFCGTFFAWFAFAPLAGTVQKELGLSHAQIGWLATAGVLLTIPGRLVIGKLVDHLGPRKVFSLLMAVMALPVAALGFAQTFTQFFVLRLLIGLVGCGFVIGIRLVGDWFPPKQAGLAGGIYAGWGNAGSALAAMSLPMVAAWIGWRQALSCAAIPMLVWSVIFWRGVSDVPAGKVFRRTPREFAYSPWRDGRVLLLALAYLATFGSELAVISFLPKYFAETFGVSAIQAGWCASIFGNLNFIARPGGGWISDRVGGKRVLIALLAGAVAGYALMGLATTLPLALIALVISALCVNAANGASFAMVPLLSPTNTGRIAGVIGAAGNLGGVLFPLAFGYGLQWFGGYAAGFASVSLVSAIALVGVTRLRLEGYSRDPSAGSELAAAASAHPVKMDFTRSLPQAEAEGLYET